jgi:hypothetical protein
VHPDNRPYPGYGIHPSFLPTAQVRTTRAGIVDYFTNFLKLSPQGKVDQSQIRMLSPTLALHSGVYSFTLEDDGKLKIVQVSDSPGLVMVVGAGGGGCHPCRWARVLEW